MWSCTEGKCSRTFRLYAARKEVYLAAYSPDGALVLVVSAGWTVTLFSSSQFPYCQWRLASHRQNHEQRIRLHATCIDPW